VLNKLYGKPASLEHKLHLRSKHIVKKTI